MVKKIEHDNAHLTLDERKVIQIGIEKRSSKVAIARTIGKDPTTVAKEIRKHRDLHRRNAFNQRSICIHVKECRGCKRKCSRYEEKTCSKRDRSPCACNKCPDLQKCHLNKYFYNAVYAHEKYKFDLVNAREGINITAEQRDAVADIIVPLVKQGQSIYQILSAHKDEINLCEKTLYNYIDIGVFKKFGLDNLSLKEKVSRKQFREKYKQRKEPANYNGRKYDDYVKFIAENLSVPTVEMDTVMNSLSGPYIQTFIFEKTSFMIGFLHREKTSASMAKTLDDLQEILGDENYTKLFSLILTDRGSEFEKNELFEINMETGEIRSNIFYCDAMQSAQKPHVENNHNYVRDIIPNGISLNSLTQDKLNLMFSHINSTPREIFAGKTPHEMFEFFYDKDNKIANLLNIQKIKRDEVVLKPRLLKTGN